MSPLSLGRFPTPVQRVDALSFAATSSTPPSELWVKRDDVTHEVYGGNKVRKLEWLLAEARARGDERVVTIGAAGSHHVLATTYFGKRAGFEVEAVLVPQPATPHVLEVLRAGLGLGLKAFPVGSWGAVPAAVVERVASGARLIPVGGSSVTGSMGYVDAARELAAQVRRGELPEPDVCVVALGSGGTAGGLAAGFALEGLKTRVVGVCVSTPPWVLRWTSLRLAWACGRRASAAEAKAATAGSAGGMPVRAPTIAALRARLSMDARFLGAGYGHPTEAGAEATRVAHEAAGLTLDPTYTAKAFACALWHVRARRARHVLYWHTLSSAPMEPLLAGAPAEDALPPALRALAGNASDASAGSATSRVPR